MYVISPADPAMIVSKDQKIFEILTIPVWRKEKVVIDFLLQGSSMIYKNMKFDETWTNIRKKYDKIKYDKM